MAWSDRVASAFAAAHEYHRGQRRKGTDTPYLTHLMAVAALVGEFGGTEDQVIAALLHDAPEDQGGHPTLDAIRTAFGDTVATLVDACSDTFADPKPPWRARKEAFLEHLAEAPLEARLIVAADKLHNMETMVRDGHRLGPALWKRFNAGPRESLWYHEAVLATLEAGWDSPILHAYRETLARFAAMIQSHD